MPLFYKDNLKAVSISIKIWLGDHIFVDPLFYNTLVPS